MKRIALVNQRYGLEVNGGSEYYTRLIAERLTGEYQVDVITTKAMDYTTWENKYTADEEDINGVHVRRFPWKSAVQRTSTSTTEPILRSCQQDSRMSPQRRYGSRSRGPIPLPQLSTSATTRMITTHSYSSPTSTT